MKHFDRIVRVPPISGATSALLVSMLMLGGCAFGRADLAHRAQTTMIGMSSEQLLSCMGPPDHHMQAGQTEIWNYRSSNGRTDTYGDGWPDKSGYGFGTAVSRTRFCRIEVSLRGGLVDAVRYGGPSGGLLTQDEQCAFAVQRCVPSGH